MVPSGGPYGGFVPPDVSNGGGYLFYFHEAGFCPIQVPQNLVGGVKGVFVGSRVAGKISTTVEQLSTRRMHNVSSE